MKNTLLIILTTAILTGGVTYYITTQASTRSVLSGTMKTDLSHYAISNNGSLHTVSKDTAIKCIAHLNQTWDAIFGVATGCPIKAFTVSAADLLAAMGLDSSTHCSYPNIRVYLGLTADSAFKLYIVAADSLPGCPYGGPDHLFDVVGKEAAINPTPEGGKWVMDLNAPCPFTCDRQSPLYSRPATPVTTNDCLVTRKQGKK
jgi:hypothetical protein